MKAIAVEVRSNLRKFCFPKFIEGIEEQNRVITLKVAVFIKETSYSVRHLNFVDGQVNFYGQVSSYWKEKEVSKENDIFTISCLIFLRSIINCRLKLSNIHWVQKEQPRWQVILHGNCKWQWPSVFLCYTVVINTIYAMLYLFRWFILKSEPLYPSDVNSRKRPRL